MNEPLHEDAFDREIERFLAFQANDVGDAPTTTQMVALLSVGLTRNRRLELGVAPQLAWIALAALLVIGLIGAIAVGSNLLPPKPLARPSNGWIAFSTQPGWPEFGHDYNGRGGDIYLVREGVEPKMIVSRGAENWSNVCPAFSPDGKTLAYGQRDGLHRAVVLLHISAEGAISEAGRLDVPGDSGVPCPRWSADGTRLAYLDGDSRDFDDPAGRRGHVVVRGLDGSTLSPTAGDPTIDDLKFSRVGRLPAMPSPAGDLVAVNDERGLVVARPDGSEPRLLVSPDGLVPVPESPDYRVQPYAIPTWSPDGKYVLAMVDVGSYHFRVLAISVLDPFEFRVLTPTIEINSASATSFPGRGDASWQPVFSGPAPNTAPPTDTPPPTATGDLTPSPSPSPSATPALPAGFTRHEAPDGLFSLAVPDDWPMWIYDESVAAFTTYTADKTDSGYARITMTMRLPAGNRVLGGQSLSEFARDSLQDESLRSRTETATLIDGYPAVRLDAWKPDREIGGAVSFTEYIFVGPTGPDEVWSISAISVGPEPDPLLDTIIGTLDFRAPEERSPAASPTLGIVETETAIAEPSAEPAPAAQRRLSFQVTNNAPFPARLIVGDESIEPIIVGIANPPTVPAGASWRVVVSVPSGDGWSIYVNESLGGGRLIIASDLAACRGGPVPLRVNIGPTGESSWRVGRDPGCISV